jgi:hypothetical protein
MSEHWSNTADRINTWILEQQSGQNNCQGIGEKERQEKYLDIRVTKRIEQKLDIGTEQTGQKSVLYIGVYNTAARTFS